MRDIFFYEAVDDFIRENSDDLSANEHYILNIFHLFCYNKFKTVPISPFSEEIINKFLLVWLPCNINKIKEDAIHSIPSGLHKLCHYMETKYNISFTCKYIKTASDLTRISFVNKEFSRFLNNPVISYSPMIIDFERYRKRKQKASFIGGYESKEEGYFIVQDIFPNNSLLLKKIMTGRFVKITLDKNIIDCVKINDILYISIKQNPYLSWEIEKFKKYFPPDSYSYIL